MWGLLDSTRLHEGGDGHLEKNPHQNNKYFQHSCATGFEWGVVPVLGGRFGHILRGMFEIC